MIIKNVNIFGTDRQFHFGDLVIEDGIFKDQPSRQEEEIDGNHAYAIPGLIDLHMHGCMGYDFCDGTAEAIRNIAKYQASIGVTAIAPATMTLPTEDLKVILSEAAAYKSNTGAHLVGINMEGPFISKEKKGAQDPSYIIPCNAELFHQFQEAAGGLVKFIGVAPEIEGALTFIEEIHPEISVTLAHTNANYDQAMAAFDRGACHVTHLHNAMPAFTHREPGVVGAAFDSKHVMAELICDGVHIHPAMVRATFSLLGSERIIFISDSMRATGMPDGMYTLGGLEVEVHGKHASLTSNGSLAGSATNLMDCLKTAVTKMNISLEDAVACATINPAKALKIDDRYGSIADGKVGNVVLLNQDLEVERVIIQSLTATNDDSIR